MKQYIQTGYNPKYPKIITTWSPSTEMEDVPEWMSDRCKVSNIETDSGKIILNYIRNSSGGYEFKNSDNHGFSIATKRETDILCFGDNRVFSLRPIQLEILYKEIS